MAALLLWRPVCSGVPAVAVISVDIAKYTTAGFLSGPTVRVLLLVHFHAGVPVLSFMMKLATLPLVTYLQRCWLRCCCLPIIVLVTGRQPPPLSSVLYGIIYKRYSVVAAQVLLREKSGA
jgi:hypothetical protein